MNLESFSLQARILYQSSQIINEWHKKPFLKRCVEFRGKILIEN